MATRTTAERLAAVTFPQLLLPQQQEALAAVAAAADRTRAHLVLPPGAGKTLIGAELARRAGRPTLVLVPNTAIAGQWEALLASATDAAGDHLRIASDRGLDGDFTVLTYQAVATFADDPDVDTPASPSTRLHPEAAAMLAALAAGPPLTLVLDEAHHLAAVWGELLDDLISRLAAAGHEPFVVSLTATPPARLTHSQLEQTERLFGPVLYRASTPALVRDGVLAPFRELVRFVTPTGVEADYLAAGRLHWRELTTSLLAPGFASTDFLPHLDAAWVWRSGADDQADDPAISWGHVERTRPELARALLRLHAGAGLLGLPDGARVREEHRCPPDDQDWAALIGEYASTVLAGSNDPRDLAARQQLRAGLRALGWTLTRAGVRRGQTPVDRLLARTVAKADAAVTILEHEYAARGGALAAVVITDFAAAPATPPVGLADVLAQQAGSAWAALTAIAAAHPQLNAVLVTGSDIAGAAATMSAFLDWLAGSDRAGRLPQPEPATADPTMVRLTGWGPKDWVPAATAWLLAGGTNVLVGTRGLLGEGWDAAGVNVLVDLTAATTPTAVVQVRGRAIRRDPAGPKAAHIWSVVAVADDHPRGDLDYRRFLTKHDGFHAVDPQGRITPGVAHVSPDLSPYAPPGADERSQINAAMLETAPDPAELALLWGVGQPYQDRERGIVLVRPDRAPGGQHQQLLAVAPPTRPGALLAGACVAAAGGVAALTFGWPTILVVLAMMAGLLLGAGLGWAVDRGLQRRALRRSGAESGPLLAIGRAVAEGVPGVGALAAQVVAQPDREGVWELVLGRAHPPAAADRADSEAFAAALAQALAAPDWPRYLVSRRVPGTHAEIWHPVPDAAGRNRETAQEYLRAWRRYVCSHGRLVRTGDPIGAGILAAVRGADPLSVTAAVRMEWT